MSVLAKLLNNEEIKLLEELNVDTEISKLLRQSQVGLIDFETAGRSISNLLLEFEPGEQEENKDSEDDLEIIFEPDEQIEHSQNVQIKTEVESSGVSKMFDIYLELEPKTKISTSPYNTATWQLPQANWQNVAKLNEVAILYRTHSQSRSIEEVFLKYGVPYRLVSGTRFLDRKEIKDVLAILKFLSNGADKVSLSRFLPLLLDGVGPKTLEKILAYLEDYEFPLAPKYQQQILDLMSNIQQAWLKHTSLIDLTKDLLELTGYLKYLRQEYPAKEEYLARLENIGELYSLMFPFDEDQSVDLALRLNQFLAQALLISNAETENDQINQPKVNLMSLHQSKGLEFETVFLVGCEDGLLPHQNSFFEPDGMEEEVRLAYVGVTRAKKHLYLIAADSRIQFGQIKANPVSRIFRPFLDKFAKRMR